MKYSTTILLLALIFCSCLKENDKFHNENICFEKNQFYLIKESFPTSDNSFSFFYTNKKAEEGINSGARIKIIRGDIMKSKVDAIVNPTDSFFSSGNAVDKAIRSAGGIELTSECQKLGGCNIGEAKITDAFKLRERGIKYIVHTVFPENIDEKEEYSRLLKACYCKSMLLAKEHKLESIAFPEINPDIESLNKKKPYPLPIQAIFEFIEEESADEFFYIELVCYDESLFKIYLTELTNLASNKKE